MAKRGEEVVVAYEPEHTCAEGCGCSAGSDVGLVDYMGRVKGELARLGSPDPGADLAAQKDSVIRARATGLAPEVAANMVYALQRGFSPAMVHEPKSLEERLAALEAKVMGGAGEAAPGAYEYVATNSSGRVVFGPTDDYVLAKRHADMAGGVVKYEPRAGEGPDWETALNAAKAHRERAEQVARDALAFGDVEFDKVSDGGVGLPFGKRPTFRFVATKDREWRADVTVFAKSTVVERFGGPEYSYPRGYGTEASANDGASDAKYERCVQHVKQESPNANPWAVCHAALGREPEPYTRKHLHWHRTPAGNAYYNDDTGYGRITLRHRPSDKPNGKLAWFAVVRKIEVAQAETKAALQGVVEEHVRRPSAAAGAAECVQIVPQGDVDVIRRTSACSPQLGVRVDSPKHLHAAMRERVKGLGEEHFWCVGQSKQGEMIGQPVEIAVGEYDQVRVDVVKVLGVATTLRAAGAESMTVCHAHPSGHGHTPSEQDKDLTKRIRKGMDAIGMPFGGHYVLSERHWARC